MKYKILVLLTLLLPISSYFLISALTGQVYDAELFKYDNNAVIEFYEYDGDYVVYSEKASYTGYLVPYNEDYAILLEEDDIVKIDRDYFTPYFDNETQSYVLTNLDDIPPTQTKSNAVFVSVASIIALAIAGMIIAGKMDLLKSHPRASATVSLIIITAIFWGLNSIISDMLSVFIIVTGSWLIYCIEHMIHTGNISNRDGEKVKNDIIDGLKGLIK